VSGDELRALAERVSNRGRWGDDDERGTLNHITESVRLAALVEVRSGRTHSIAQDIDFVASARNPRPATLEIQTDDDIDRTVRDEFTIAAHGFATTHADAVGHCYFDDELYNGRARSAAVSDRGLEFGAITAQADGVVTRGVLLDVAAVRGTERLSPGDHVTPADLDAAERLAGTTVRAGDAIFVHVGSGRGADPAFLPDGTMTRVGLSAECLVWLHDHRVAVYSGDCVDVFPSPFPEYPDFFHQIALGRMGLAMLDCPNVGRLVELCRHEARSTFLLTYAPLRIPRGTGSPVNPLVMF